MAGVSERGIDHIETMNDPQILNSVDQIDKLDKVARRTFGLKDDKPYEGFSPNVLTLDHPLGVTIGDPESRTEPGVSEQRARLRQATRFTQGFRRFQRFHS